MPAIPTHAAYILCSAINRGTATRMRAAPQVIVAPAQSQSDNSGCLASASLAKKARPSNPGHAMNQVIARFGEGHAPWQMASRHTIHFSAKPNPNARAHIKTHGGRFEQAKPATSGIKTAMPQSRIPM